MSSTDSPARATIADAGYHSTHYWVGTGESRILVDFGYPGTMGMMRAQLRRLGVPIEEIRYGLAMHYHIDHAGFAQELMQTGMQLIVVDTQTVAIPPMKTWAKPRDRHVDIYVHDNFEISFAQSCVLLERIGLAGEFLPTPGHSDDSVSPLLDEGGVFTDDLTHPSTIGEDASGRAALESWRLSREHGATHV